MSVRAHAALWVVGIAAAWLVVGGDAGWVRDAGGAAAPDTGHVFVALADVHLQRLRANALHAGRGLQPWADQAYAWLPLAFTGFLDGLAQRRARRCSLEPFPDLGLLLGRHALVVLAFAPLLWASLVVAPAAWGPCPWAIALALALSFTLSRVQGLGLRR